MRIFFELAGLPKSLNGSHGYWRAAAAERKRWRQASCLAAKAAMARVPGAGFPWATVKLTVTRCSPIRMDADNRAAAAKGIVDGLVDAGVVQDDNEDFIVERSYPWMKVPRNTAGVRVEIENVTQLVNNDSVLKQSDNLREKEM